MGADFTIAGRTEEIVGICLTATASNSLLQPKAGLPVGPEPWNQGASRKHLLDDTDGSFRRFGTDHVTCIRCISMALKRRLTKPPSFSTAFCAWHGALYRGVVKAHNAAGPFRWPPRKRDPQRCHPRWPGRSS